MMKAEEKKHKARRRIWRFRDLKLQTKFLLIIMAMCIGLQAGNIFSTQGTYQAYNEQLYRMMTQTLASFTGQMESEFGKIETLTLSMIGDSGIQKNLMTLNDSDSSSVEKIQARSSLKSHLGNYMLGTNAFVQFNLFVEGDGSRIKWNPKGGDRITADMAEAAYENGSIRFVIHNDMVLMCRRIRQTQNIDLSTLATMVGIIDLKALVDKCSWVYTNAGVGHFDVAIFDADQNCLYCEGEKPALLETNGYVIQNGRFMVQVDSVLGWRFVFSTPHDAILSSAQQASVRSMLAALVIALAAMLLGMLFVRMITLHLDTLLHKFDIYAKGQLPTEEERRPYQERFDEIGRLHRHFDRMALENQKLSEENYNRMLLYKETEYRQLQQQIQPHFIFNALTTIMWMAHQNGDEDTAELTVSLAQLLRASMNVDNALSTVQEEIKNVQAYMNIQRVRYRERVQFVVQIPCELQEVLVPHMTLQPLVENSIHYAVEEMLETCIIRIDGRIEGENAVLIVEDNGSGMDEDMLNKLDTGEVKPRGTGIGLRNIHQRIQLAFSQNYGLSIHSDESKTQIFITVPLRAENNGRL